MALDQSVEIALYFKQLLNYLETAALSSRNDSEYRGGGI